MQFLRKYLLFIFVFENILAQTPALGGLSNILFYIMLGIGVAITPSVLNKKSFNQCRPLYYLGLVYLLYEFTIGYHTISSYTLQYVAARITTFSIIIFCVTSNFSFYASRSVRLLTLSLLLYLIYSIVFDSGNSLSTVDRQMIGFTNPNTTSAIGTITLAGLLFLYKRYPWYILLSMLFCLYIILAGGGRNAMLMGVILILFRYGVQWRTVALSAAILFSVFILFPRLGISTAGVERINKTASGEIGNNREAERKAAFMMIAQRPLTGWGYGAHNVGKAKKVSELGSHSGYIDTIKFMGYPFALLTFFIMFYYIYASLPLYRLRQRMINYHIGLVTAISVGTFFECYFVGVHEFESTMFYVSLAILSTLRYRIKNQVYGLRS